MTIFDIKNKFLQKLVFHFWVIFGFFAIRGAFVIDVLKQLLSEIGFFWKETFPMMKEEHTILVNEWNKEVNETKEELKEKR